MSQRTSWIETLDSLPGLTLEEKARARVLILARPPEDRPLFFEGNFADVLATIRALLKEPSVAASMPVAGATRAAPAPALTRRADSSSSTAVAKARTAMWAENSVPNGSTTTSVARRPRSAAPNPAFGGLTRPYPSPCGAALVIRAAARSAARRGNYTTTVAPNGLTTSLNSWLDAAMSQQHIPSVTGVAKRLTALTEEASAAFFFKPGDIFFQVEQSINPNGGNPIIRRETVFAMIIAVMKNFTSLAVKIRAVDLEGRPVRSAMTASAFFRSYVVPDPRDNLDSLLDQIAVGDIEIEECMQWRRKPKDWPKWDGSPKDFWYGYMNAEEAAAALAATAASVGATAGAAAPPALSSAPSLVRGA
ncbi:hypothetical protein Agub_g7067, partial [Astrephomene gubernaculifera]